MLFSSPIECRIRKVSLHIQTHMVCTWCAHGVHMVCTRCAHGVHMMCTRCAHGVHIVCTWCAILSVLIGIERQRGMILCSTQIASPPCLLNMLSPSFHTRSVPASYVHTYVCMYVFSTHVRIHTYACTVHTYILYTCVWLNCQ